MSKIASASASAASYFKPARACIPWPAGRAAASTLPQCGCESDTLRTVRAYLREHFPGWAVRDFHERTRLVQIGLPDEYSDHHVVNVTDWERAYYAVLPTALFTRPLPDLRQRLRNWDLAERLRVNPVLIVSGAGVTAL